MGKEECWGEKFLRVRSCKVVDRVLGQRIQEGEKAAWESCFENSGL